MTSLASKRCEADAPLTNGGPFALSALVAACGAARRWEHGLAIWQGPCSGLEQPLPSVVDPHWLMYRLYRGWPARKDLDHTCQNAALHLFAPLGRWVAALQAISGTTTSGVTGVIGSVALSSARFGRQRSCRCLRPWAPWRWTCDPVSGASYHIIWGDLATVKA